MRELVQEIDSYVEAIDLEITSTLDVAHHMASLPLLELDLLGTSQLHYPPLLS